MADPASSEPGKCVKALIQDCERAVRAGFANCVIALEKTAWADNSQRAIVQCAGGAGAVMGEAAHLKPTQADIDAQMDWLQHMVMRRLENITTGVFRECFLNIDEESEHKVTACPNPLWRYTWAKYEGDKASRVYQFALRNIKRP